MSAYNLPDIVQTFIPSNDASIWDIIQFEIPSIAEEPPDSPFIPSMSLENSTSNPSTNYKALAAQPAPPERFLYGLRALINDSEVEKPNSLLIPWFPTQIGQPGLWIVNFWERLEYLRWLQEKWKARLDWLRQQRTCDAGLPDSAHVYNDAIECLKYLRPDERLAIRGQPARGEDLEDVASRLLSRQWLSSGIIEHMLDLLRVRINISHPPDKVKPIHFVLPPGLHNSFVGPYRAAEGGECEYRPPAAARVLNSWLADNGRYILFALNINNVHWVAACADLHEHIIRVGDSLGGFSGARDALAPIQAWLQHLSQERFRVVFDLLSGDQEDGHSCGLFTVNTLAAYALNDPLLTHQGRHMARASAFVEIARRHMETVNRPNSLSITLNKRENPATSSSWELVADISNDGDEYEESAATGGDESEPDPDDGYAGNNRWRGYATESEADLETDGNTSDWMDGNTTDEATSMNIADSSAAPSSSADSGLLPQQIKQDLEPSRVVRKRKFSTPDVATSSLAEDAADSEEKSRAVVDEPTASPDRPKKRKKKVKTAVYDRATLKSLKERTFVLDPKKWREFRKSILEIDNGAAFNPEKDPRLVRCLKCGQWLSMHLPYHVRNFKKHSQLADCRKQLPQEGTALLSSFPGFTLMKSSKLRALQPQKPPVVLKKSACRGLGEGDYEGIDRYISRTSYSGGGSHSVTKYAEELFGRKYRELEAHEKDQITARSYQDQRWRVAHIAKVIYSTNCLQTVEHPTDATKPPPCTNCCAVLDIPEFKNAVRRPTKEPKNLKYTNARFLNSSAGVIYAATKGVSDLLNGDDKKTVAARYAAQVIARPDSENSVFYGLVRAMLTAESKKERGVGLQNFHYESSWWNLSYIMLSHSASAYHTFRSNFRAPLPSSFKKMRSQEMRFPLTIGDETFKYAKTYFDQIGYAGPLCLSCDDTKLLPSLRMYYDPHTKQWQLVGGTKGPINVADNDELVEILKSGTVQKAPKVRTWVLQAQLPGIAPLAFAALPVPSTVTATILTDYLRTILDGLFGSGLQVVSYASDGNIVEQNVQDLVFDRTDTTQEYRIPFRTQTLDGKELILDTVFKLHFYKGNPLIIIQDSKHALKTFRNNLYSGARLLVMGDHVIHYALVREIAFDDSSTLYRRDVEKLDRQDDQAASRLFSAATLAFIVTHRPAYLALVVYLFILGELCDAYQSRKASHAERARMAMRAYYFMKHWENFLHESGYPISRYFISREASAILSTLVSGIILLIVVYRDHLESRYPLLMWLHSTEGCEHIFGELRKLFPSGNFTHCDMIYANAKLRHILQALYKANFDAKTSTLDGHRPKKATGYDHTCMDNSDIDLSLLTTFPTDYELAAIDKVARIEAANLARAVNIYVDETLSPPLQTSTAHTETPVNDTDPKGSSEWAVPVEDEIASAAEVLQELFHAAESGSLPMAEISKQRDNIVYAASTLEAEHSILIDELPAETSEDLDANRSFIKHLLANLQPRLNIPDIDESLFPVDEPHLSVLDPKALLPHRWAHQTKQAYKSPKNFRQVAHVKSSELDIEASYQNSDSVSHSKTRVNQYIELARSFHQTLRDSELSHLSERAIRWTNAHETDSKLTGNVANAKLAADKRADSYVAARCNSLRRRGVNELLDDLSNARITSFKPLNDDDFVWVLAHGAIELGQVRCIYVKEGGRYANHAHVPHVPHLGYISYLGVQIFERVENSTSRFRARRSTLRQNSLRFQQVPVNDLLLSFDKSSIIFTPAHDFIEFTSTSAARHLSDLRTLTKSLKSIKDGVGHSAKPTKRKVT
ncbi:hypothetical protein FRC09_001628 [Ceratobasidium sp. 395]|nr:hypothetical protein FRC09_001628 [Ceratobasidium sp. 395]